MRREYKWVDRLPAMITHSSQPLFHLPNCKPTHSTQFRHISPIYPHLLPISTYTLLHLPTCYLGSSTYPLKRVFLTFLPTPVSARFCVFPPSSCRPPVPGRRPLAARVRARSYTARVHMSRSEGDPHMWSSGHPIFARHRTRVRTCPTPRPAPRSRAPSPWRVCVRVCGPIPRRWS